MRTKITFEVDLDRFKAVLIDDDEGGHKPLALESDEKFVIRHIKQWIDARVHSFESRQQAKLINVDVSEVTNEKPAE